MDSSNFGCSSNQHQPSLCAAGCGFFGSAATQGFCSKCYKNNKHVQKISTDIGVDELRLSSLKISDDLEKKVEVKKRCDSCNKKLGLLGFMCRCEGSFCNRHRHPEAHGCQFDFKKAGKILIQKQNPLLKPDKLANRI